MISFTVTWSLQVEKLLPPILRERTFTTDSTGKDFKLDEPQNDYIEYILLSSPGHWKEFVSVGVQVWDFLQSNESQQVIRRRIQLQLENDVIKKPVIDLTEFPTIKINSVILSND